MNSRHESLPSSTLALSDGGTAPHTGTGEPGTRHAFTYAVRPGDAAEDLSVVRFDPGTATLRDAAGNDADLSGAAGVNPAGTLVVDTAVPEAPAARGFGARPGTDDHVVRGTAEAGSTVEVFDGAVSLGAATAGADRGWSLVLPGGLAAGTHALTATATDAAENPSAASSGLPVTVAGEPPAGAEPAPASFASGARGVEVTRTEAGDLVVSRDGVAEVLRGVDELRFIDGRLVFDRDDTASRVARLYRAGFGRDVDQGGLDHWTGAIEGGASPSGVARSFLDSPEGQSFYGAASSDAEFVDRLYRDALGREGDAGGRTFWTERLGEGASRADVLAAVADGAENEAATAAANPGGLWDLDEGVAQVARLYDAVLGRLPDAGGLAFWAEALDGGRIDLRDMAGQFLASAEYRTVYGPLSDADFVWVVYRNALDRPGDAGGVGHWMAGLDAGLSRAAMVVSFSESPEHVALTAPDMLGGAPGQFGILLA